MNILENNLYQNDLKAIIKRVPKYTTGTVLVTGATGLIGSMIVDSLMFYNKTSSEKIKIYCLGRSLNKLKNKFEAWNGSKFIQFIEGDICNVDLTAFSFDYIIHAASNADPKTYALQPVDTILTNINGTLNILEYAKKNKKCRVLYTSTFEVYGKVDGIDIYNENMYGTVDCQKLRSGYPESKRTAELLFRSYGKQYGIDYVIARLSSVYGPTMSISDSKAHAQFIRNALNDEDIVLKSEGKQLRTYTYSADAVSAILFLLFDIPDNDIYNVANGQAIASIAEVAQCVAGLCGHKVIFDLPDELEKAGFSIPQNTILDTTKIENKGWKAEYSLQQGMQQTIKILGE